LQGLLGHQIQFNQHLHYNMKETEVIIDGVVYIIRTTDDSQLEYLIEQLKLNIEDRKTKNK
jgi:hypothetical protein